jgi:cell division protein FtsL
MQNPGTHAFINQLLLCTLVMVGLSGSVGLGTVWMRHQISLAANETKRLELETTQLERRVAEFRALIATEQSPEMLERKNVAMRLHLAPPREAQLVRVSESPEQLLLARRNVEIFADDPGRAAGIAFSLANLN